MSGLWMNNELDVTSKLDTIREWAEPEPASLRSIEQRVSEVRDALVAGTRHPSSVRWEPLFQFIGSETLEVMGGKFDQDAFVALLLEKHRKYGLRSLSVWRELGVLTRIDQKLARWSNLVETGSTGTHDESLIDTQMDIIGYCVIGLHIVEKLPRLDRPPTIESTVAEFQRKYGSPAPRRIDDEIGTSEAEVDSKLAMARGVLESVEASMATAHQRSKHDARALRVKLMVSELAEVVKAMQERDEVELADGLADLLYVVAGTATTYMMPLTPLFFEVHRSNMTKSTVAEAVANHTGDKGKGEGFEPPRIRAVLAEYLDLED